jgi:hypothetical protein
VFSVEGEASLTEANPYQYSEITLYLFLESTRSVCTCVFNLSSSFVISFVYVCVNLPVSHVTIITIFTPRTIDKIERDKQ